MRFANLSRATVASLLFLGCTEPSSVYSAPACSDVCLSASLVHVLVGHNERSARPVCLGTLIATGDGDLSVLTAAHCAPAAKDGGVNVFVRGVGVDQRARPAVTVRVHPGFDRSNSTTLKDFALLTVPSLAHQGTPRLTVLSSAQALRVPLVTSGASTDNVDIIEMRPTAFGELSVRMADADGRVCRGSSGAPVLVRERDSWSVVGVVSHGSRDCVGEVTASLIDAPGETFVRGFSHRGESSSRTATCSACAEELAQRDGPCVTAMSRCAADGACTSMLASMRPCEPTAFKSATCSRVAEEIDVGTNHIGAVVRCLCHTECRARCSEICAAR